ncbi:MAG TPA: peptidoglycan-binding domain-containing protein [Jatrophihabitans sp.]|jgi:hypothetical protein
MHPVDSSPDWQPAEELLRMFGMFRSRLAHVPLRLIAVLALTFGAVSAAAVAATPAEAISVPSLRAPAGLPRAIEPMADYVAQTSCQPAFRSGTLALGRLLVRTYPNTSFGGNYACGTDGGRSEHYDGRAVDWMNTSRDARHAAQAASVIKFLLATDRSGNKFAMARRMGVMYIIWNNNIWGSWDGKWAAYNNCAKTPSPSLDSACHRNHMHISLSWNGALGRTSFWSKHVFGGNDYGPCRAKDLNWAANYARVNYSQCRSYPAVGAPRGSSSAMQGLVRYSGVAMGYNFYGPPIAAVQAALRVPVTYRFDSQTTAAVNRFKRAHRLVANGVIDALTWRNLLAVYKPKR